MTKRKLITSQKRISTEYSLAGEKWKRSCVYALFIIVLDTTDFNTIWKEPNGVPGLNYVFEMSPTWPIHLRKSWYFPRSLLKPSTGISEKKEDT
jgi:hypothetical protein